jgi:hypothetical protein
MHGLAAGMLDGSILGGDAGGGMSQGFLLYYMAASENNPAEMSYALKYLRNRLKQQTYREFWPSPLASYYLGDVPFPEVLKAVNHRVSTTPLPPATLELGRRKRLCVALFHDGVKSRAQGGDEAHCLARMRECYALENPVIVQEWYLARYEVEKADSPASAR